jgi:Ion channel
MLSKLLIGWCLLAVCVVIHAAGVISAVRWIRRQRYPGEQFLRWTWIFICVAGYVVFLHLSEITVWALLYFFMHAMPDLQSAFYFSGVTYTTTGYGDLVLPEPWRLVGGIEALTGILMCAWSSGFFFAVVGRMYEAQSQPAQR